MTIAPERETAQLEAAFAAPAKGQARLSEAEYHDMLLRLSEGSVHQHFEAFVDIAWDDAEYAVTPDDRRWILPESDIFGKSEWYNGLSEDQQIAIGMWRCANVAKVGMQFENLLIRGVMEYLMKLPNGSPEFRYCTHEVTEETHHTQMFQEFVNRVGVDVPGGPWYFKMLSPWLSLAGRWLPEIFFLGILAGEEPIDHLQKSMLREGAEIHPLMTRVMQIHVAEEARHISFAHEWLRQHVPTLSKPRKAALSLAFPVVMRVLCDVIMRPDKSMTKDVGVPKEILDELFWDSPEGRETLRNMFADVRMLADQLDLMNPASRRLWKLMKIDGRSSRYRSEPYAA
jgi:hypothetical protein